MLASYPEKPSAAERRAWAKLRTDREVLQERRFLELQKLIDHQRQQFEKDFGGYRENLKKLVAERQRFEQEKQDFEEKIKNSDLASGVKVGHFSYLGDAQLGANTNVGAGTITANFDGVQKHRTEIGERVFLGSDTILRAPVRLGDDARTGAGSVVTKDVEPGATVVGVPARRIRRKPATASTGEEG